MQYKEFYIAIGEPGAYNASMAYSTPVGVYAECGALVKHMPFLLHKKAKEAVTQTWLDEEGDDVYLPKLSNGTAATKHEAEDLTVEFAFHKSIVTNGTRLEDYANQQIGELIAQIDGNWLRIFDEYTGIGYDGVYFKGIGDDPRFMRRQHDTVIFGLVFRVNGSRISRREFFGE